ncbi:unnamed protein product [Pylaiella littoralis]
MRNDRGRRGGKAGAKSGRAEGRGGRGQPRNGGRGGGGGGGGSGKRIAGSIEAVARVGTNAPLSTGTNKAQRRAGSRANKKVKTGEAATNVLWNSAGKGKGTAGNGGGSSQSLDGGVISSGRISSSSGDAQDLSALAKKFKERFGEEVASDDEDDETTQISDNVFETPGRKRRFSIDARPKTPVEEVAQSMSPAKLAAEVQKARARAREERFGGSVGSSLTTKPSPAARPLTRAVSIGKAAATAPRETPPPARTPTIPLAYAATRQQHQQCSHENKKVTGVVTASASSPPQEAAAVAAGGEKGILPSAAGPKAFPLAGTASTDDKVSPKLGAVAPLTITSGASAQISAHPRSTISPSPPAASPVFVRPDPQEVDMNALGKSERRSPDVAKAATTGEAMPVDKPPPPTITSGAAPKRPAPDGMDAVAAEPPAKKVLASPKTPSLRSSSLSPSQRQAAGATGGTFHTLRLRLRTDLVADPKQPAQMGPPATGGGAGAGGSSGVEERTGPQPPNPAPDAGVEECKGFDPPNLPPTSTSQHRQDATPAPSSDTSTGVASAPAGASTRDSPGAVSRSSVAGDGGTPTSSTFPREGSWGPSFGIVRVAGERTTASPLVPATPAPSPVVSASKARNPWILSPDTPTFARNQGRPLAQCFPQPTTPTGGSSNGDEEKGRSAGRTAGGGGYAVAVVPSVVARSGNGGSGGDGVRRELGESGGDRTPAASKAPASSSPRRASPPTTGVSEPRGSNVTDRGIQPQARLPSSTRAASNAQTLSVTQQGTAAGGAAPVAGTASEGVGAAAAAAAESASTRVEGGTGAAQVLLGVHMSGRAGQLLDRLKREREESLDFERKLTQALLDL